MIAKQKIRISYIEKISMKHDSKKIKYYEIGESYCKISANSVAIIPKQEIRITYIKKISVKSDAKK